ncbi:hypothetical protein DXG03_005640 [Asterophora parasitica]|uniref:Uncharacterized protein n=1 Tax=Asterophora parasitica TaxID=117018 RepID=A0A9P7G9W7_9AGAR|nr:hypothetical protein DXG03_005640 [Asterophora parasitica]
MFWTGEHTRRRGRRERDTKSHIASPVYREQRPISSLNFRLHHPPPPSRTTISQPPTHTTLHRRSRPRIRRQIPAMTTILNHPNIRRVDRDWFEIVDAVDTAISTGVPVVLVCAYLAYDMALQNGEVLNRFPIGYETFANAHNVPGNMVGKLTTIDEDGTIRAPERPVEVRLFDVSEDATVDQAVAIRVVERIVVTQEKAQTYEELMWMQTSQQMRVAREAEERREKKKRVEEATAAMKASWTDAGPSRKATKVKVEEQAEQCRVRRPTPYPARGGAHLDEWAGLEELFGGPEVQLAGVEFNQPIPNATTNATAGPSTTNGVVRFDGDHDMIDATTVVPVPEIVVEGEDEDAER